jgi:hypothetical protein
VVGDVLDEDQVAAASHERGLWSCQPERLGEPGADHLVGRVELGCRGFGEPAAAGGVFDDRADLAGEACLVWDRDDGEPAGVSEVVGRAEFGEWVNGHARLWSLLAHPHEIFSLYNSSKIVPETASWARFRFSRRTRSLTGVSVEVRGLRGRRRSGSA